MTLVTRAVFVSLVYTLPLPVQASEFPIVNPAEIITKYGKPDRIQSAEFEKPRPPFVTKMLEYKKQNVRYVFLANAQIGSPPPYKSWYLMGTQDPRDNSVIASNEADQRMLARLRK